MDYKFDRNRDGTISYYIRVGSTGWKHQEDFDDDGARAKQARLARDQYAIQHDRLLWKV